MPHYAMGWVYDRSGRYAQALEEYLLATKLRPEFVEAYRRAAWMYCAMGGMSADALIDDEQHLHMVAVGYHGQPTWRKQGTWRGEDLWLPRELTYNLPKPEEVKGLDRGKIEKAVALVRQSLEVRPDLDFKLNGWSIISRISNYRTKA